MPSGTRPRSWFGHCFSSETAPFPYPRHPKPGVERAPSSIKALARHGSLFELSAAYADLEAVARGDVTLPSDEVVPLPGAEEKEKDIVALRRRAEKRGFETVAMAAKSLAHVVAHAARRAAVARDLQPEEGLEAWDASAPLLSQWREEAVAQRLKVDFSDAAAPHTAARMAHQERDRQVEDGACMRKGFQWNWRNLEETM